MADIRSVARTVARNTPADAGTAERLTLAGLTLDQLDHLNGELEKPRVSPGFAFMAGTVDAELTDWLLHHCPSELVWGIPTKPYATALGACAALEPELRRFERNTIRLMTSIQPAIGK